MNRRHRAPRLPTVRFDEQARKEYLTGFQKRKKQRKSKALQVKLKKAKAEHKKLKQEKRSVINKKLEKYYGKDNQDEGGDKQSTSEPATGEKTASTQPSSSTVYFDHPDHFVVVDTQPNFGNSLTNMCNEHSDTELT